MARGSACGGLVDDLKHAPGMKGCILLADALASGDPLNEFVEPEALTGSSSIDLGAVLVIANALRELGNEVLIGALADALLKRLERCPDRDLRFSRDARRARCCT